MNVNWTPTPPAIQDANTLLISFETAFIQSIRSEQPASWPEQFGYIPPMAFPFIEGGVRFPVDFTVYGFDDWSGEHEFQEEVSDYLDMSLGKFQEGAKLDVEKLRHPLGAELILWGQRQRQIIDAWKCFVAPKVYEILTLGDATGSWRLTGGSNFFATDHKVNKHRSDLGTFSNLLRGRGDPLR
jgi:hypothetical protein